MTEYLFIDKNERRCYLVRMDEYLFSYNGGVICQRLRNNVKR